MSQTVGMPPAQLKDNGGPAFPRTAAGAEFCTASNEGMSLRDYFAGNALIALSDDLGLGRDAALNNPWDWVATQAYAIADAMLAARTK